MSATTLEELKVWIRTDPDQALSLIEAAAFQKGYRAGVEDAAKLTEESGPATQDMIGTEICASLDRVAARIRALHEKPHAD